jgi:hypothetical protein
LAIGLRNSRIAALKSTGGERLRKGDVLVVYREFGCSALYRLADKDLFCLEREDSICEQKTMIRERRDVTGTPDTDLAIFGVPGLFRPQIGRKSDDSSWVKPRHCR